MKLGKENVSVSIRAKSSFLDFDESELKIYSILGAFVNRVARLEYDLDQFIFDIANIYPRLAFKISRSIPVKPLDKTNFLIDCFILIPPLRSIGDLDGQLDLNFLAYGMEELWPVRNHIIHAKIDSIENTGERIIFQTTRFRRISAKEAETITFRYTNIYFEKLLRDLHYFSTQIWAASEAAKGRATEQLRRRDKLRKGQVAARELGKLLELQYVNC